MAVTRPNASGCKGVAKRASDHNLDMASTAATGAAAPITSGQPRTPAAPSSVLDQPPAAIIPEPPLLTLDDDRTLRSALAVVVLRRRLLERLRKKEELEKGGKSSYEYNEGDSGGGRRRTAFLSGILSSSPDIERRVGNDVGGIDSRPYNVGGQSACSPLLPPLRSLRPPSAAAISSPSDWNHLRAMIGVAVSTAASLYPETLIFPGGIPPRRDGSGDGGDRDRTVSPESTRTASPLVYDFDAACAARSSYCGGAGRRGAAAERVALDGLASHLAAQIRSLVLHDVGAADASLGRRPAAKAVKFLREELLCLLRPLPLRVRSDLGGNKQKRRHVQRTMAVCTVLHRIVHLDSFSGPETVSAICGFLRDLYYDEFVNKSYSSGDQNDVDSRDVFYPRHIDRQEKNNQDNRGNDPYSLVRIPSSADIAAVNLLYLLEGVIAARLIHDSNSDDATCANSCTALEVVHDMRIGLGAKSEINDSTYVEEDLTLPIIVRDMAAFYWRERKKAKQRGRSQSEGKIGLGQGKSTEENGEVGEILSAGGKMMLRMCLYDITRKLSSYFMKEG